jgi:hypothetical protein
MFSVRTGKPKAAGVEGERILAGSALSVMN